MKILLLTGRLSVVLAILVFFGGCSTTQQTENLLTAAGFKTIVATTAKQKAHLTSLPSGKITPVQKEGTTYFVFPDARRNLMFVGSQTQYAAYQNLRIKQQIANEKLMAAEMNEDAAQSWQTWGPVWGPAWGPVFW